VNIKIEDIYHELGHTLFAYILNKYHDYGEITIIQEDLKNVSDGNVLAAAKIIPRIPEIRHQLEFSLHNIIIAYSGMCAQTILLTSFTNLDDKINDFKNLPEDNLISIGGGHDMKRIKELYLEVYSATKIGTFRFRDYMFEIIFNILKEKVIFNGLKNFAEKIISLNELVISKDTITKEFKDNGIENFIQTNRENYYKLISETFPIKKK